MDSDAYLAQVADGFSNVSVTVPSVSAVVALLCAVVFLLVSGFASVAKVAFFSLPPSGLADIGGRKQVGDVRISRLLADAKRLWASLLITDNLASVAAVILCNFFFLQVFHFFVPWVQFVVLTIVLALLLLLVGELAPKMLSAHKTLAFCRMAAPGVEVCCSAVYPLASVLLRSTSLVDKYVIRKEIPPLPVGGLMPDKAGRAEENKILEGIIRFGEETAKEIMTSRLDMVDLELHTPFKDVLKCIVENVYSRIPVYSETRDNIKGILYIKDLLPHLSKGDNFRWQSLIRPAYFVPETKMIDELLRDFQANKIHIAIVVDEFGGTSGLVTMEDVIEEIVGEIRDEYDDEEHNYVTLNDHTWIFEAKTQLIDFYKITQVDEDMFDEVAGDADTLAGLLLELKGEFPALHEKVVYGRYTFEVLEMDNRRILKVKFTINPSADENHAVAAEA